MKRSEFLSPEDLANDRDFLRWVKGEAPKLDAYWRDWMAENPARREMADDARQLILAVLQEEQYPASESRQAAVWERIRQSAGIRRSRSSITLRFLRYAALVIAAAGMGAMLGQKNFDLVAVGENPLETGPAWIREFNDNTEPRTVVLTDGSVVILQPNSTLEYPRTFDDSFRQVSVVGEAFFEVAHDADRPFVVRADAIITRVLGTSFTVRNFVGEENVIVRVKSGKVSVYRTEENDPALPMDSTTDAVVLMPNQQVAYEKRRMKLIKSLVDNPVVLAPLSRYNFEFVDVPISRVFRTLERAYGVQIVYDEEAMSSCYLNASLSDVLLHDKLKLICKAIDATYEIIDSHIVIYGRGCRAESENLTP